MSTPFDEMYPLITADGTEMFFSRKVKDGWRVCYTRGPKAGESWSRKLDRRPASSRGSTAAST